LDDTGMMHQPKEPTLDGSLPDAGQADSAQAAVDEVRTVAQALADEIGKAVVGQEEVVRQCLIALLAGGHVLLEGVPGVAKTLLVRALAIALDCEFKRVQFTPDLMPSDVVGTMLYDLQSGSFRLKRGPIFTSLLLADEINRTPPKTQAALLEAMEERQVSIDGITHPLPTPFMVFATQNPIEHEGTYALPEAQLDRFTMKVVVGYPSEAQEKEILLEHHMGFDAHRLAQAGIVPRVNAEGLRRCMELVRIVTVDDGVLGYITSIVRRTRESPSLVLGASPRAAVTLLQTSKVAAAMAGRAFVIPDDVKSLAKPVLRHRVVLRAEAEIEGLSADAVLDSVVSKVEVPR